MGSALSWVLSLQKRSSLGRDSRFLLFMLCHYPLNNLDTSTTSAMAQWYPVTTQWEPRLVWVPTELYASGHYLSGPSQRRADFPRPRDSKWQNHHLKAVCDLPQETTFGFLSLKYSPPIPKAAFILLPLVVIIIALPLLKWCVFLIGGPLSSWIKSQLILSVLSKEIKHSSNNNKKKNIYCSTRADFCAN